MSTIVQIGTPPWTREEIIASVDEFSALYEKRPIKNNRYGMKTPHMFAVWFMARKLAPDLVVESGIWKGQSTWLLEEACPDAKLISIDLNLSEREYVSKTAEYSDKDFFEQDWSSITDRSLVFFDDHQNAYTRLQQCKWFGFKNIIFEDNYPITQGDCYSLKKAFANAGFEPAHSQPDQKGNSPLKRLLGKLAGIDPIALTPQYSKVKIEPNSVDADFLKKNLALYYEFPPLFKAGTTRWGDSWNDATYPTPAPLLEDVTKPVHKLFLDEAIFYTWICYARLKL